MLRVKAVVIYLKGGKPMSFETVKKTIDICKKGLFKTDRCYYYFCYFDENKNKLSLCTKAERTFIIYKVMKYRELLMK